MACTNCSTGKESNGVPRGCQSKGTCGTDGCNKLTVFDWLANMVYPSGTPVFDIVEVRFKNGRKDFYRYPKELNMSMGDVVATEASPGHDIGIVSLTGELVKVQMKKKQVDVNGEILKIYRKATQKDIDIWQEARAKEEPVRMRAREIAISLNLEMKISDVEFQGDGSKATFYYTASERVDFRQLIKDFAREFSIRIEMKQVGFRQEAARLGGIGSCGRELCCSTWLTDFRSVNTAAARYQQLSLNPQKLAGQCGKLKCCLNFELDTYLEAIKDMPDSDTKLLTVKGLAICQKIDIFKGQMWFAYANNSANWYVLSTEQVKEILALNANEQRGQELESYSLEIEEESTLSVVEEDSVTRFDQPKRRKKPVRKKEKEDTLKEPVSRARKNSESANDNQPNPRSKNEGQAARNKRTRVKPVKKEQVGNPVDQDNQSVEATTKVNKENRVKREPRVKREAKSNREPREKEGVKSNREPREKEGVKSNREPREKEGVKSNREPREKQGVKPTREPRDKNTKDQELKLDNAQDSASDKPKVNRNNRNKNRRPKNSNNSNDTKSTDKQ